MDQRILDYAERLPPPGPKFNEDQFYAKGATILEDMILEILDQKGIKKKRIFSENIKLLRTIDTRDVSNKVIKSIHWFRKARNGFLHNTRATTKTLRIERRFVRSVEKSARYKGKDFPIACPDNKRQWRLYLAYTVVWENMHHIANPTDEFYPVKEIMNGLIVAMINANEQSS